MAMHELCNLCLRPGMPRFVSHPESQDNSSTASTMKVQALVLLRAILAATFGQTWDAHVSTLKHPLLAVLGERYYKVTRLPHPHCPAPVMTPLSCRRFYGMPRCRM